jgi:hypothetical protein
MLTYSLEVYNGDSRCPPDPATKLQTVGTATDSASPTDAMFHYVWPSSLESLNGVVLVLRAVSPSTESTVGVVCTAPLVYTPSMQIEYCNGS